MDLQTKLFTLPDKCGVYVFKDKFGRVIYVGKAASIRQRVRAYFQDSINFSPRLRRLSDNIGDIDYILTDSEKEALILECNLIKKHRPGYNIRLRDDKRYPYLKITYGEAYPRIMMSRRMKDDGAKYFGPYTPTKSMWKTVRLLKRIFGVRTCKHKLGDGRRVRLCLDYHIGQCLGPCSGKVSAEKYDEMLKEVSLFLEGKQDALLRKLYGQMEVEAKELHFERAARLRDQIRAIERVIEYQKITSKERADQDIIALEAFDGSACIQLLAIREGKLVGEEHFILEGVRGLAGAEILNGFVKQYYLRAAYVPEFVVLQFKIPEANVIAEWLSGRRGDRVRLLCPRRGERYSLVKMTKENAQAKVSQLKAEEERKRADAEQAIMGLQKLVGLAQPPYRIEAFDISNIGGKEAVGSMVVFEGGRPKNSDYRRFKLKFTDSAPDDYAMLQEVMRRRYLRGISGGPKFGHLPDLILVDGGKGQLNCALAVLKELDLEELPVISLAKEFEHMFLPDVSEPVCLPEDSASLLFLKRVRDEAHRFAITYHRKLREKINSVLDAIPGIGERRKQALMSQFGSITEIKKASVEELARVPGMNRKAAEGLKAVLGGD